MYNFISLVVSYSKTQINVLYMLRYLTVFIFIQYNYMHLV